MSGIVLFLIIFIYIMVLLRWVEAWSEIQKPPGTPETLPTFSIIVAARNESLYISHLLECLERQYYPKELYEIIVVNDHSTDDTVEKTKPFTHVTCISLHEKTGKKAAVTAGIQQAKGTWIVTTDADCTMGPEWLKELASATPEKVLISAPVHIQHSTGKQLSFLQQMLVQFQQLEFSALIGIGGASIQLKEPNMCNGANLAYKREVFFEINGYTHHEEIASGDDEFLMHQVAALYPQGICFLKSEKAIVYTSPEYTLPNFLNQRTRWASKHRYYQSWKTKLLLLLVLFANLSSLAFLCAACFYADPKYLVPFAVKFAFDYIFLGNIYRFFNSRVHILALLLFQPVYPLYLVFTGLRANLGSYSWKGRKH